MTDIALARASRSRRALLLLRAAASPRARAERNPGTHRFLLNRRGCPPELLGSGLRSPRLRKLLQGAELGSAPRSSIVGWTFGHHSLLDTVERTPIIHVLAYQLTRLLRRNRLL